jgi:hypothetical protein
MTAPRKTAEQGDWAVPASSARVQPSPLSLSPAVALARAALPDITTQPFDGIASAERDGPGWRVVIEVIESPARLGDNDLLAAYELMLDAEGELLSFRRLRRYHREEREP